MIVDTSVWIDYFNGVGNAHTDRLDDALGDDLIVMGDLILTELLQGFRADADYRRASQALGVLEVVSMVGPRRAVIAAENYRQLRQRGVTVRKTMDVLIATYCIDSQQPLLFSDREFQPFVDHLGLIAVAA